MSRPNRSSLMLQCTEPGCGNRARVCFIGNKVYAPKGWLVVGKGTPETFVPVVWCLHHAPKARAKRSWLNWDNTEVERELDASNAQTR